ncbi:MAG TPA: ABC transporter substrate-binding protein [Blastocatellia bacterium]|jgi:hypothetical protein|nr:ABC transporter substrate-binding protein [Blastocatellia bacterium]
MAEEAKPGAHFSLPSLESTQRRIINHPLWVNIFGPLTAGAIFFGLSLFQGSSLGHAAILTGAAAILGLLISIYAETATARTTVERQLASSRDVIHRLHTDLEHLQERIGHVSSRPGEKLDISVANFNNFLTYVPLYVAAECGFFCEESIEANIYSYQHDLGALGALASRRDYFAISDPIFVFDESVREEEILIIAPFINKAAVWALSKFNLQDILHGAATTPVCQGQSLTIKTFGKATTAYRLAERLRSDLAAKDAVWANAHLIELDREPDETMEAFFLRNFISGAANLLNDDILVFSEPETSYLTRTLPDLLRFSMNTLIFQDRDFSFTSVLARERTVKFEPELVRRFLRAIQHAQTFIYSLPSLPDDPVILSSFVKTDPWAKTISAIRKNIADCYPPAITQGMDDGSIANVIDSLRRESYFSTNVLNHQAFNEGLNNACGLSKAAKTLKVHEKLVSQERIKKIMRC